jgi:hypothetical protein
MSSKLKPFSARIHANCGLGAQDHHILRGIGGSAVCATSPWTPRRIGGGLSRSDKSCLGRRGARAPGQVARRDNSLGEATADPLSAPVVERRKSCRGAPGMFSSGCERGSASTGSLRSDVGRREVRSNDSRVLPGAARTIDVLRGRSGTWWSKAVREAGIPRAADPRGDPTTNSRRAFLPRHILSAVLAHA